MEKGIYLQHKNSQKEFFLSKNTPLHFLNALIKKAFHLTTDIKSLRHPRGFSIPIQDAFNFNNVHTFQIVLDEDFSDDKSRSQTFSQKALTKRSGRKYPPHEKELNDAKLFVDDFQFFMTEVGSKKNQIFLGLLFFNNKKAAQYLGKKVLRQLIYEFDQMHFFYCLHPIKRHSNSPLLGETIIFSVFKGTKMIHEREFPENLSATEEIIGYLKCLIKNGELPECYDENQVPSVNQPPKNIPRQNLIQVNEQRSFDAKVSNDLGFEIDPIPHKIQKSKTFTADHRYVSPISKIQTPIKSHIHNQEVNEISFENDFYQPDWFTEGNHLNRLQKSFLAALVKTGNSQFVSFCHGLDLKNKSKESLNAQLVKVFLKDFISKKMSNFSEEEKFLVELNQENRQSYVFSLLLKLHKFGNIDDFINSIRKKMNTLHENKCSYVDLARQIQKKRTRGLIKLRDCDDEEEQCYSPKHLNLITKDDKLEPKYSKIANLFHKSVMMMPIPSKIPHLPNKFSESEKAIIIDSILHQDPFMIQNYIESKWSKKKFPLLQPDIVKKYLEGSEVLFGSLLTFPFEETIQKKLRKVYNFSSLLYYLYKQRTISLKQKKAFFYLYIWSDLNVLSCFELYCFERNLEDFIETMFIIDYTYYLEGKYGVDMNEVENFSNEVRTQLVLLFLMNEFIPSMEKKTTLEKFIRAGDTTLLEGLKTCKDQEELVTLIVQISENKKKEFEEIQKNFETESRILQQKIKEMINFCHSIIPVHFKFFKKEDLLIQCIENQEPIIHGMFDVYFQNKGLMDWMESFRIYTDSFYKIHMKCILKKICEKYGLSFEKLEDCRTDLVQGIYEVHLECQDEAETAESLERAIIKSFSGCESQK